MKKLKSNFAILMIILIIVTLGYAFDWYGFKTMLIVLFSILIGGYFGSLALKD